MNGKQVKKLRNAVVHFVSRLSDEVSVEQKELIAGKMYKRLKQTFESLDKNAKAAYSCSDENLMSIFKEITEAMTIQNRNRERYEQKLQSMYNFVKKNKTENVEVVNETSNA